MLNRPSAAVIIPVYNDSKNLLPCLDAMSQSRHDNLTVLVVDDGSTEPIQPLVERYGYNYIRIEGPGGPARARNRGVHHVKADILIFIDADVCVHKDTISRFIDRFFEAPDVAAVVGSYDNAPAHPGFFSQYRNLLHHYTHQKCDGEITTFWTGCGAIRRSIFTACGGFDEERYKRPMIEDIELGTWLAADGYRILLDPQIQCKHLKQWSLSNMLRTDLFQRGIVWIDLMLRSTHIVRGLNVSGSQRISVILVGFACLSIILALGWPWALLVSSASLLMAILININLYRYLAQHRGIFFALKAIPIHWLYFICCGLSVVLGVLKFYLSKGTSAKLKEKRR